MRSVYKYTVLLKFHLEVVRLATSLNSQLAYNLQRHTTNFTEVLHEKRGEVLKYFTLYGDREGTVTSYRYYSWCKKTLRDLDKEKDMIFAYRQILDLQRTLGQQLQEKCNPKCLLKSDKKDIREYLRRQELGQLVENMFLIKEWCIELRRSLGMELEKHALGSPLTTRHKSKKRGDGDSSSMVGLIEKMMPSANKAKRGESVTTRLKDLGFEFEKYKQYNIYKIVMGWWLEELSVLDGEEPAGGFGSGHHG